MEEFITCDVCMEVFDGDLLCPRVLLCGHTFCSCCIQKLLIANSYCPTCKISIATNNLESISINYRLKQLAEKYSSMKGDYLLDNQINNDISSNMQHQEELLPSVGMCIQHKIPKRFKCMTCNIWVCGDCVAINHKICNTLLMKEVIENTKKEKVEQIMKRIKMVPKSEANTSFLMEHYKDDFEKKNSELQYYQRKINLLNEETHEANEKIEKVLDMQTVLTSLNEMLKTEMSLTEAATSLDALDAVELNLTKQFNIFQEFIESVNCEMDLIKNKEKVMACITADERVLITTMGNEITPWGNMTLYKGEWKLHCVQQEPPPYLCLTIDQCLSTMTGRKTWPRQFFLQLGSESGIFGDVIIHLNESAKEASKSVLHTSFFGHKGISFKGKGMDSEEDWIYSGSSYCVPPEVDCEKLLQEEKCKEIWKKGELVLYFWDGKAGMEFCFWIYVKDSVYKEELVPTGDVIRGMDVVEKAYLEMRTGGLVTVMDCGWIIT